MHPPYSLLKYTYYGRVLSIGCCGKSLCTSDFVCGLAALASPWASGALSSALYLFAAPSGGAVSMAVAGVRRCWFAIWQRRFSFNLAFGRLP